MQLPIVLAAVARAFLVCLWLAARGAEGQCRSLLGVSPTSFADVIGFTGSTITEQSGTVSISWDATATSQEQVCSIEFQAPTPAARVTLVFDAFSLDVSRLHILDGVGAFRAHTSNRFSSSPAQYTSGTDRLGLFFYTDNPGQFVRLRWAMTGPGTGFSDLSSALPNTDNVLTSSSSNSFLDSLGSIFGRK